MRPRLDCRPAERPSLSKGVEDTTAQQMNKWIQIDLEFCNSAAAQAVKDRANKQIIDRLLKHSFVAKTALRVLETIDLRS